MYLRTCFCICVALAAAIPLPASGKKAATNVRWKKVVIDKKFRSEGVAVADVNKDGKNDILVGDLWYEAPSWKIHVIRKKREFNPKGYSQCFACWADDINKDGWADLIVIGFPGAPCHWYENPKNKPGPWSEHFIWHSACNETPQYVDLFKNGKRVLVMGWQPKGQERMGQMAWFAPGEDVTKPWIMHPISRPSKKQNDIPGTFKYDHGLGVGDVNGDKRADVICTGGWWEQRKEKTDQPWPFHKANLGPACADMFADDLDGDNVPDIISSSAHNFGIWWHKQSRVDGSFVTFIRRTFFAKLFSQSHALHYVDINGDGLKDLVTGRRWWAHGGRDPGGDGPAVLYWFEAKKSKDGVVSFVPHKIDDDSGVATQFAVTDFNGDGRPDIIVSNKKGVCLTLQVAPSAAQPPARKE